MKRSSHSRRTIGTLLVSLAAIAPSLSAQKAASSGASPIRIPFEKYTLANGLTVLLAQDHSTPTVAVEVLYHVGSKNEQAGRTGFAHLFEHVMFTGSKDVPYGVHDKYTEGVGGSNNGNTTNDFTQYYETIPSNYLEHALWLESDRMGWLLDALDTAKYNAQREIVKNERRQSYDNRPYGRASEIISAATYPKSNPYSWPVIGSMTDLSAASVDDVKQFFRLYYTPNNAVLAIAGDFDAPQTKAWIAKYFAGVPRGKPIVRPKVAATVMPAEKRLVYEDRVQVPRLFLSWPTVGQDNDDQYALDVLSDVLTRSRISRLTKALVYDKQSASAVSSNQGTNENAGEFEITITPRPGHSLTELEADADSVIATLRRDGPTADEIERSKATLQLSFLSQLESNLGKAMRLAIGEAFDGNPEQAFAVDYRKYQAVTAADVKRVANKYLGAGRVVLSIVPIGKKDQASKPGASVTVSQTMKSSNTKLNLSEGK
ncbi:MAG: pitrilysin family protein [Gemmatimonadaceae bacterium]